MSYILGDSCGSLPGADLLQKTDPGGRRKDAFLKLLAKPSETNKARFEQAGVKYFVPFALLLDSHHFSDVIHTSTRDRNKKYFVEVQVL